MPRRLTIVWNPFSGFLSILIVSLVFFEFTGCKSPATKGELRTSAIQDPIPVWVLEATNSPARNHLLGIGVSTRSEKEARENAMADISRQIMQVLNQTNMAMTELRLRLGDTHYVGSLVTIESNQKGFGSPWDQIRKQACIFTRTVETNPKHIECKYYILVEASPDYLRTTLKRIEAKLAEQNRLLDVYLTQTDRAARKGDFQEAVETIVSAAGYLARQGALSRQERLAELLERLSSLVSNCQFSNSERWDARSASYRVQLMANNGLGIPLKGVPFKVWLNSGKAGESPINLRTDASGRAWVSILPESGQSQTAKFSIDTEQILLPLQSMEPSLAAAVQSLLLSSVNATSKVANLTAHADADLGIELALEPRWRKSRIWVFGSWYLQQINARLVLRAGQGFIGHITLIHRGYDVSDGGPSFGGEKGSVFSTSVDSGRLIKGVFTLSETGPWITKAFNRFSWGQVRTITAVFEVRVTSPCSWMNQTRELRVPVILPAP